MLRSDQQASSSASVNVVAPGQVTSTANPQVALYTMAPPSAAEVSIQFGPTTNYGLSTWTQPAPVGRGPVGIYVAGMLASSTYHMHATINFADGAVFQDLDRTFTTGAVPAAQLPPLTATTTPGMTPQPGIELLDLLDGVSRPVVATDLSGNVLWTYTFTDGTAADIVQPVKMLPTAIFW